MKKAKSETQLFRLFSLLTASETVAKATIVSQLGVKESSVPVYIHSLKKKFGAVIENVTEGRVVTGYKLVNRDTLSVPQFKRTVVPTQRPKAVAAPASEPGEVATLEPLDDFEPGDLSETLDAIGYDPTNY